MLDPQPTIVLIITVWSPTRISSRSMLSLILEPFPIRTYLPMVTFGPTTASGWMEAVGWMQTLPLGMTDLGRVRIEGSLAE